MKISNLVTYANSTSLGSLQADVPWHDATSVSLSAALPFIGESGDPLPGPVIGTNRFSGEPFSLDPWALYSQGVIKSLSVMILGTKGSGKSMLAKSWSTRLIRFGVKIAVPHDPNGEWSRIAEVVGGRVVEVGGSATHFRLNPFSDPTRLPGLTEMEWQQYQWRHYSSILKSIILILRSEPKTISDPEHTIIDEFIRARVESGRRINLTDLHDDFQSSQLPAAVSVGHTVRRLVTGDLAGLFTNDNSTPFDTHSPLVAVNTGSLRSASSEAQAVMRLTVNNWIRQATNDSTSVQHRVVIHEEAAIALLGEASDSNALVDLVAQEKVGRHLGLSNWYILHRVSDLDAIGDEGSAVRTRAIGLLSDTEIRVLLEQKHGEVSRAAEVFDLNKTQTNLITRFEQGEALWLVGTQRQAVVQHRVTGNEYSLFTTDKKAGERSESVVG